MIFLFNLTFSTLNIFIIFNFLLLININNAYYPINKFNEDKNEVINTILTRPQYLYRHFAPMARGAFISPLFGYRYLSLDPPKELISNEINNNYVMNNYLINVIQQKECMQYVL
ncbi:hypothetical protein Mgra_00000463, partial [Meloidogyne graminicola]